MSDPSLETSRPPIASMLLPFSAAALVAAVIWWACFHLLPSFAGLDTPIDRVVFASKCVAVAGLLTLMAAIEAVAHRRLTSAAFDPLAGRESPRLQIDLRNLQNTLEQFALFAPALVVLAIDCEDGSAMRAVVAATIVWIVARYAFWIGYHVGARHRIAGMVGHAQTLLMLLYVSARFGHQLGGAWGAAVPLVLFGSIECAIVAGLRRR